ncbi:MAG: DegT/DnrJ/EryC1/StrS family aminotransferase [Euryarchaeota archaeon]|nr:DegT/DnrJ/EryC1/StrS family aminotransferase [Euryarchaeota archaeon]
MDPFQVGNDRETRDNLAKYLNNAGIMTKIYFEPIHQSHFYKNKLGYNDKLPITEQISSTVLTLPMYPTLQQEEMEYITERISLFFSGHTAEGGIK